MQSATSMLARMGVHRRRLIAVAALLLATISLAGELVESHQHEWLGLSSAPADLPTVGPEHEQHDPTDHLEGATRNDPDSCPGCIACLAQQRRLAVGTSVSVLGDFEPYASAVAPESVWGLGADTRRLQPSRGPPRA